jgi:hypothetical protein
MSLLYFNRGAWHPSSFHRLYSSSVAILACGGPSLNKVDPSLIPGPKKVIFGLNNVYPRIRPDVWVGMDDPHCYNRDLFFEPFIKILRGGYQNRTYNGVKLFKLHNMYYATLKKGTGVHDIFADLTEEGKFVWHQNSFATMLNIILWMGHREIYLAGCDFSLDKGDYFDNMKLSNTQRQWNNDLYNQLSTYLFKFSLMCKPLGIKLYSMSPDSKINAYLDYVSIEDLNKRLYQEMPEKTPIYHAIELDPPKK